MIVLQVAYDGTLFSGSQRQPDANTVENKLIDAFYTVGLIKDRDPSPFRMMSRTDKGVSARENYLMIDKESDSLYKHNRIDRVNRFLEGIWITGHCNVQYTPPYEKQYRYFLNDDGIKGPLLEKACSLLSGTHDYSNFSKSNPSKTTIRTISMSCAKNDDTWCIYFQGTGFLWQMCRRLVSASTLFAKGQLSYAELKELLDPKTQGYISPSDPCHLLLYSLNINSKITPFDSGLEKMNLYYHSKIQEYSSYVEQYKDIINIIPKSCPQ